MRLFKILRDDLSSHFFVTKWTDGKFGQRLEELQIPYTESWLGMFSRHLDPVNLKMTLHCVSKMPVLYWDFSRLLRRYKPDVLYVASYHDLILLLPLLMRVKIPIVYHVHNVLPTAKFYRLSFALWGRIVDHYIPVSRSVQTSLEMLGVSQDKISLLYNGIDRDSFPFTPVRSDRFIHQFGWPRESIIIGMTGQMFAGKGHWDFVMAANMLQQEHADLRFVIGGKEEGAYYEELKRFVADLGLDDMIGFAGWQDFMSSFYNGLDVFVFPSYQQGEGFGLVIIEALASGVPAVVARAGGSAEAIEDGISGLLVEPQAPHQLADAIQKLARSAELRLKLSRAGQDRVTHLFDLSQQAMQFKQVIHQVVGAHDKY